MRASIWDAILAGPFYNMILATGVFFTGLALAVGANNFQIGLFAAVGPLLSGLSLLAAWLLEKDGRRKPIYLATAAGQRGLFFGLLFFPWLEPRLPAGSLPWLLLALVTASMVFHFFQLTAWMSWMADMIPGERRGSFFSRRNLIAGSIWMLLSWQTGKYLDAHKGLESYALVFSLFAFSSLVGLYFSAQQPDPPMQVDHERRSLGRLWRDAWTDASFRNFLLFHLSWGFTMNLAAPFYNVYMLKNLGLDMARVSLWSVFAGVFAIATIPYWGRMLDKAGARSGLSFALAGTCLVGFLWPFVGPGNLHWLLPLIIALGTFFTAGVQQASFNMLLGIVPSSNKASHLALFQAVVGSLVGFSPIAGGLMAQWLPKIQPPSLSLDPVMAVIIVSAVLRLLPLLVVSRIRQGNDRGIGYVFEEFVLANPFRIFADLYVTEKQAWKELFGGGK